MSSTEVRVVEERPISLMLPLQELDRPAPGEHFRICGGEWEELSMTEVSLVPARSRRSTPPCQTCP